MSIGQYLLGGAAGLVFGLLVAAGNTLLTRRHGVPSYNFKKSLRLAHQALMSRAPAATHPALTSSLRLS